MIATWKMVVRIKWNRTTNSLIRVPSASEAHSGDQLSTVLWG